MTAAVEAMWGKRIAEPRTSASSAAEVPWNSGTSLTALRGLVEPDLHGCQRARGSAHAGPPPPLRIPRGAERHLTSYFADPA